MDIKNIFCQSLGVTSHAKTFLTVCRFQTDLVSVWTGQGTHSKNSHPFERLGLSVREKLSSVRTAWAIRLKKVVIRLNGLGYPFEKIVICSNGSGYLFKKEFVDCSSDWFFSTSFPKIIFFIFHAFVVYKPAEWNFIFLACQEHKTRKIMFLNWLHFFFSRLFLYHKEVTRVFSSMLNFAWQFSATCNFTANSNMQIW